MAEEIKTETTKPTTSKRYSKRDYVYAVGRRKEATARVRLYANIKDGLAWGDQKVTKEQILVNGKPIEHYFPGPLRKVHYMKPFEVTQTVGKYGVTIRVNGGGQSSQLDAVVFAISRVLSLANTEKFRKLLKKEGLLTRDPRVRERRKAGMGGKARRKKQSPKR